MLLAQGEGLRMEEFIFDDEMNDVGAEIEAHCPKCHSTAHTIVSKYEDEVRRVQCNACGHVHPYKKPRDDDEAEPLTPVKKKPAKAKPTFDQIMAKSKKPPRAYNIGEFFKELEIVSHPKFGTGYVTENIGNDKIEVTFQTEKRVLIHNRKGLNLPVMHAFQPEPAAKGKGKAGKPAAAVAAPAKAAAAPAKPVRASSVRPSAKPAKPAPRAAKPVRPVRAVAAKKPVRAAAKKPAPAKKKAGKAAPAKKPANKKKR
jgi:Zn ribbon nucleic-acid-binding protein